MQRIFLNIKLIIRFFSFFTFVLFCLICRRGVSQSSKCSSAHLPTRDEVATAVPTSLRELWKRGKYEREAGISFPAMMRQLHDIVIKTLLANDAMARKLLDDVGLSVTLEFLFLVDVSFKAWLLQVYVPALIPAPIQVVVKSDLSALIQMCSNVM